MAPLSPSQFPGKAETPWAAGPMKDDYGSADSAGPEYSLRADTGPSHDSQAGNAPPPPIGSDHFAEMKAAREVPQGKPRVVQELNKSGATQASPKSAESRISGYKAQSEPKNSGKNSSGQARRDWEDRGGDLSEPTTNVASTGDKLTGPQRRRAVHKAGKASNQALGSLQGYAERTALTDPDRNTGSAGGKGNKSTYMNPEEFHKMDTVRDYNASDGFNTGHDLIPGKMREIERGKGDTAHTEGGYPALEEAMRKGGPAGGKVPPILLTGGTGGDGDAQPRIGNGGHRLALADKLGWKMIPVTRARYSSGYGDARGLNQRVDGHSEGYDSEYESSYHQGSAAARADALNTEQRGYAPGARSHVPQLNDPHGFKPSALDAQGNVARGKGQRGFRWHGGAGQDTGGQGLYTQLHGPALQTTSEKQFGRDEQFADRMDQRVKGQEILPGMENTMHVGRSKFDGAQHWKGGAATGAAPGQGAASANWHMPQESVHKFGAPKKPGQHGDSFYHDRSEAHSANNKKVLSA